MKNSLTCEISNIESYKELVTLIDEINRTVYDFFQLNCFAYYDLTIVESLSKMQEINYQYRNKDKSTDVISVCLWDQEGAITPLLGEIFICLPQIKSQAKEYNFDWKYEFTRMLIHSILHLFGFHHEEDDFTDKYVELVQDTLAEQVSNNFIKKEKEDD